MFLRGNFAIKQFFKRVFSVLGLIVINFFIFLVLSTLILFNADKIAQIYHNEQKDFVHVIKHPSKDGYFSLSDLPSPPDDYFPDQSSPLNAISGSDHDFVKYPENYMLRAAQGNYSTQVTARHLGKVIYSVNYDFDQFGRRKVVSKSSVSNVKSSKFALLFGCSYTIGEGVEAGFDFPSQLQTKLGSDWRVYNFGFHGYSPASILNRIYKYPHYLDGVSEEQGIFVYTFIPDHLLRFFCKADCYLNSKNWWSHHHIETSITKDQIEILGSFESSQTPWRKWAKILIETPMVRDFLLKSQFPSLAYSQEEYDQFFLAVNRIAELTGKKFSQKVFFIAERVSPQDFLMIEQSAAKFGFELAYLNKIPDERFDRVPGDGHPGPARYWYFTEFLNRIIVK